MYGIGRLGRGWIGRHAWFARVLHVEREEQIRRLIARHGIWFFFGARFLVGVRGPLYVTLGILRISFLRFLLIDSLCASLVVFLFFGLSYYFGGVVFEWIRQGEYFLTVMAIAAVVVAGGTLWWYHNRRKTREAEHITEEPIVETPPNVAESLLGVTPEELLQGGPEEDVAASANAEAGRDAPP
jgi:membrane protein DedA with SNARE-associated domain